jgi:ribosome biogenesis GTPase
MLGVPESSTSTRGPRSVARRPALLRPPHDHASGGWIVDWPGIRSFALGSVTAAELAHLYPGFGELPDACRFGDCRHKNEPGCAVLAAVESGELPEERHASYLRVIEDVEARKTY